MLSRTRLSAALALLLATGSIGALAPAPAAHAADILAMTMAEIRDGFAETGNVVRIGTAMGTANSRS